MASSITLKGSAILANGQPILTQVPPNIVATPISDPKTTRSNGCFMGFDAEEAKSRHEVPIGKLKGIRFMSIFRFKLWWSTHWVGNKGKDIENETQIMILDKSHHLGRPYVLLLPLLEGSFAACLQSGGDDDYVDLSVDSGSTKVCGASFRNSLYIHVDDDDDDDDDDDPFSLVKEAIKVVRDHLGFSYKLLEEKCPPGIIDKFGWCTWDAFYREVHPKGIWEGVKGLVEGGCPPGFVLIDDGWQSVQKDDDDHLIQEEIFVSGTCSDERMPYRLINFQENYKFREYESPYNYKKGMGAFVKDLKEEFQSLVYVYVWHALCGYWGGIRPDARGMPESRVVVPKLSQSLQMAMEDLAVTNIMINGIGVVLPKLVHQMYEGLHSHLESVGIDGVKIDVIHVLEMLCEEYGGRIELAKAYYKALTSSVKRHFKGNGVLASMEQCNDFMFLGTESISLGRVGDDFWCTDPAGDPNGTYWLQGCHMVHCAYNSLWMGNFTHPDWDMFQSTHSCVEFHAASRAISGGPIYVSDSVGKHNFALLKSLVLPDGSILRCQHYALPTRDCLFEDPLHDGKTMLKVWNLNKYTGILGAFNCQGGGWCPQSRRNRSAPEFSNGVTSYARPKDIEWSSGNDSISIEGVDIFVVFMFQEKKLKLLKPNESMEVSLEPFSYELLTISPVSTLVSKSIQFAPIGLVNMLNSGGAIQSLVVHDDESLVRIGVKGCGEMRIFVTKKPLACQIDGVGVEFCYDDYMVSLQVWWPAASKLSVVEYLF